MKSRTNFANNDGCFLGCFAIVLIGIGLMLIAYYGAIFWLIKYGIDSFSGGS